MDERELGEFIDAHFTSELFRLETLDRYHVGSDGDDLARYLAGEPGPDMSRKGAWMEVIRGEVARGLNTYRVHVVTGPLSDYLRFECEWGYTYNAQAGEHIRILDLAEQPRPDGLVDEDFWLISGPPDRVARMRYDPQGRFLVADAVDDAETDRYRRAREAAWEASVPFAVYWASHPQYRRDRPRH
jgi:hypothetical protein